MKKLLLCLSLLLLVQFGFAQFNGIRFNAAAEKQWKLNKKLRLTVEQELQITPDFKPGGVLRARKDKDFKDIDFIDDDFLQRGKGYDGDDDDDDDSNGQGGNDDDDDFDDDDDDDNPATGTGGTGTTGGTTGTNNTSRKSSDKKSWGLRSASSLNLTYQLNKLFLVETGYVLNLRDDAPGTHVFYTDAIFSKRFKGTKLSSNTRFRFQSEGGETDKGFNLRNFLRLSTQLRLRTGKISPFISSEIFYRMDGPESKFNRFRTATGLDFRLNPSHRFRLQLDYQQRFNVTKNATAFTAGIGYLFSIGNGGGGRSDDVR